MDEQIYKKVTVKFRGAVQEKKKKKTLCISSKQDSNIKFPKCSNLETSVFRFSSSFSKVQKVKYLHPCNHPIISVNLPMVNIYKFHKKEILIKPPGEPREQHLGDPKSLGYTKNSRKTK